MLLFPSPTYHLLTQRESLLLVLRENGLMTFFLMLGVKHGPIIAAVILDLQSIRADQDLSGANEGIETILISLKNHRRNSFLQMTWMTGQLHWENCF